MTLSRSCQKRDPTSGPYPVIRALRLRETQPDEFGYVVNTAGEGAMDLGVGNFLRSPETENESWMPWRHNSTSLPRVSDLQGRRLLVGRRLRHRKPQSDVLQSRSF